MDTRRLIRNLLWGFGALAVVSIAFYLLFHPHVLHPIVGQTWIADDGHELTNWPHAWDAFYCPTHEAYHTDLSVCMEGQPTAK